MKIIPDYSRNLVFEGKMYSLSRGYPIDIPDRLARVLSQENSTPIEKQDVNQISRTTKVFGYVTGINTLAGSSYKYYTVLKREYGGIVINGIRNLGDELKALNPDLVFVGGDWTDYYKAPLKLGIPYVLIEHDIKTLRDKKADPAKEKEMIENAAALILTSEGHRDYLKEHYVLPKYEIIHLRPLSKDILIPKPEKLKGKHLVYAGGINADSKSKYGYRDYTEYFKKFLEAGWNVHIHPLRQPFHDEAHYKKLGCEIHETIPYNKLIREMGKYTAGFIGYNKEGVPEDAFEYTQKCRPNKTWDYLAAWLPTIGYNPGDTQENYLKGGWGVTLKDLSKKTLQNIKLPEITEEIRTSQTIDNDIEKFDNIIKWALNENA